MLKYLLSGAAVLALSGHTVFASNVFINGVPHSAGQAANISYGSGAIGCCETTELSHTLPVLHPSVVGTTTHTTAPTATHATAAAVTHTAAPAVTYQTAPAVTYTAPPVTTYQPAPVVTHQAAPVTTYHSAPVVTHQVAPVAPRHEIIINQLPAPVAAPLPVIAAAPIVAAPAIRPQKPAANSWNSRVYVGARGGITFARDADVDVIPPQAQRTAIETDFNDPGYTISGVVGWAAKVNNNIQYRLEAELGYSEADVDSFSAPGFISSSGSGDVQTIFAFANAYVDVPVFDRLSATLGGGIGAGRVKIDDFAVSGGPIADDFDTAFGYHLDAGLTYDVTDRVAIEALYRYTSFVDVDVTAFDGTTSDTNIDSHNVLVGARYGF